MSCALRRCGALADPRGRSWRGALTLIGVCLGAATPLLYQTQKPPVFRAGVDLVALDVTVVDRDGRPVKGLSANDFDVRIDGERRPVRVMEFLEFGVSAGSEAAPARSSTNQSPAAVRASRGGRVIVLLFDDLSIKPGGAEQLTIGAERMLSALDADDLVGLTTTSGLGPAVSPTRDRAAIVSALRSKLLAGRYDDVAAPFFITVKEAIDFGNALFRTPRDWPVARRECAVLNLGESCASMVQAAARRVYSTAVHRVAQQVAAYRATIDALKAAPKPRVVIALSAGVALGAGGDEQHLLDPLSRAAAEAEVQFYAMAEVADLVDLSEIGGIVEPQGDRPSARRAENDYLVAGIQSVATAAGGDAFKVIGQAERFFGRVFAETSGVYRLGVETPVRPAQRFLDVKVAVNRPRLTVRANRHAIAPAAAAAPVPVEQALQARLAQGGVAFGVPIALATALRREPSGDRLQLAIETQVPKTTAAPLVAMFALVDDAGKTMQSGRRAVPAAPPGDDYRLTFAVPVAPGQYRLRFAVADGAGNIGSVHQAIVARLVRAGALSASDLLVSWNGADNVSRFLALDTLPPAATTLRASIELYPDDPGAPPARVRFVILRQGDSTAFATLEVTPAAGAGVLTATTSLSAGDLAPGTYTIQATILDAGADQTTLSAVFRKGR
jgi:VWFA-related protein